MLNQALLPAMGLWSNFINDLIIMKPKQSFGGIGDEAPQISFNPPCYGTSWNGDFSYRFSPVDNNPTIRFIPSQPGVGVPTCILYWSTDPGNMPGYFVKPNMPYTLNATKGTKIYFYYTYLFPGAGERNNSTNKDTYVIGSCKNIGIDDILATWLNYYPKPLKDWLYLELNKGAATLSI